MNYVIISMHDTTLLYLIVSLEHLHTSSLFAFKFANDTRIDTTFRNTSITSPYIHSLCHVAS